MQRLPHFLKFVNKSNNLLQQLRACQICHLYSDSFLGIERFTEAQERTCKRYGPMRDNFMSRIKSVAEADDKKLGNVIFSEDLKNLAFLAKTDEEFELLINIIQKYVKHQGIHFASFVFGPVVLRLCNKLNKADSVMSLMLTEDYGEFFQQITSYNLAANLLYKNERYENVVKLYDHFKSKPSYTDTFPSVFLAYVLASCYKLNTEESYKVALNILNASRANGDTMFRRSIGIISGFALKRGDPVLALEVLSIMSKHDYSAIKHLRVAALCELERIDDALLELRLRLNKDSPKLMNQEKFFILNETLLKVKKHVDGSNNPERKEEFRKIEQSLRENNIVGVKSFEEVLFAIEDRETPKSERMNEMQEIRNRSRSKNIPRNRKQIEGYRQGLL